MKISTKQQNEIDFLYKHFFRWFKHPPQQKRRRKYTYVQQLRGAEKLRSLTEIKG